ncbi:MAG: hypothetical protein IJI37_02970 [Opitutales bacterium]|nr:hypothetical protein [Opitutales bacterium]
MKKLFIAAVFAALAALLFGCESTSSKPSRLPSRQTDGGDLPWAKPAQWEGGLPGMGGVGNPTRY